MAMYMIGYTQRYKYTSEVLNEKFNSKKIRSFKRIDGYNRKFGK